MKLKSFQPILFCGFFMLLPLLPTKVTGDYPSSALEPMPYLLFAVLGFLSIKVNQTRLLFTSLSLALGYGFAMFVPQTVWPGFSNPWTSRIVLVAIPLSLLALQSIPEGRIRGSFALGLILSTIAPILLLTLSVKYLGPVGKQWILWSPTLSKVPTVAAIGLWVFGMASFLHRSRSRARIHRFVAAGLVPAFLGLEPLLHRTPHPNASFILALGFACSAAILHYGIFLLYWERVYLDELTGIPNRRALDEKFLQLDSDYSVAMVDIDHFKKFNDTYGHENGDMVLRYVARHLAKETRNQAYRYGGEEFTVLLKDTPRAEATRLLDKVRARLAKKRFKLRTGDRQSGPVGGESVQVTVSVGVSSCTDSEQSSDHVLKIADEALYEAKNQGRNCTVMAAEDALKQGA